MKKEIAFLHAVEALEIARREAEENKPGAEEFSALARRWYEEELAQFNAPEKYAAKNQCGYSVLSLVLDHEEKTAVLYHGCTAPIDKYTRRSKKEIRRLFDLYAAAGYNAKEV